MINQYNPGIIDNCLFLAYINTDARRKIVVSMGLSGI